MAQTVTDGQPWKPLWKPERRDKAKPVPISQTGRATAQRSVDKRTLLKGSPATHEGYHRCYIGAHLVKHVDLEHVFDSSERPDLFTNPNNHDKACNKHNVAKKLGTLTDSEFDRVVRRREEVLNAIGEA